MSDFYIKKQRKFWCDTCRIFIEYNKMSIDHHNKSKNHLRMLNADQSYQNMKNKINRHNVYNFGAENENTKKNNFLKNKTGRDDKEFEYSYGYGKEIKDTKEIASSKNISSRNVVESYQSSSLLAEIKKEKMRQLVKEKFNITTKCKNERVWSAFLDPNTGHPYYFNFVTQTSQWEKPEDFDGPEIQQDINGNESKEVVLGKWEFIDKSESFFEKNKAKDVIQKDYLPGVITFDDYNRLADGEDFNDEEENEFEYKMTGKNEVVGHKILYQPKDDETTNKKICKDTIDKFIYENEDSSEINLENENNKRKNIESPKINLRLISQNYKEEEDTQQEQEKDDKSEDVNKQEKVSFTFNQIRKNQNKFCSIFNAEEVDE